MWLVRSATTKKPSDIKNLLEDGFEPFTGFAIENKHYKFFFKKDDSPVEYKLLEAEPLESKPVEINLAPLAEVVNQMNTIWEDMFNQFLEALDERIEKLNEKKESYVKLNIPTSPELAHREPPINARPDSALPKNGSEDETVNVSRDLTNQFADVRSVEGAVLRPEDFGEQNRVEDDGGSFQSVEAAPVARTPKTFEQEKMISQIREYHKTNITVFPRNADGSITVHAEDMIYKIREDGSYSKEINLASRTSSI